MGTGEQDDTRPAAKSARVQGRRAPAQRQAARGDHRDAARARQVDAGQPQLADHLVGEEGADRRAQIVDAAYRIFAERGYHETNIATIAADLGITNTELAFAYGVATVVAAFLLPVMGRQVERFGPRRSLLGIVVLFGIACVAFAMPQPRST